MAIPDSRFQLVDFFGNPLRYHHYLPQENSLIQLGYGKDKKVSRQIWPTLPLPLVSPEPQW
jgi:hypothetical protein